MASSTLTLAPDDALSLLEYWHASAERLLLVDRRTAERVIRMGRARVRSATARELRIDTDHGRLSVGMHSAAFEFGMLGSGGAAPFRASESEGLLIRFGLEGWMFLRSAQRPGPNPVECRLGAESGTRRRSSVEG